MLTHLASQHGLEEQVRNAFAHLYDYAYLQTHPLADRLDTSNTLDHLSRAQALRRVLLDALETLHPRGQGGQAPVDHRAYMVLTYRYVDGLPVAEIMAKLALSRRQVYREHAKGIEAIASHIAAQHRQVAAMADESRLADASPHDRLTLAHAEVDRLRQTAHPERVSVGDVIQAVATLLAPRFEQTGVSVSLELATSAGAPAGTVIADRTLLRQALFNLLSHAVDEVASQGDLRITLESGPEQVVIRVQEVSSIPRSRAKKGVREGVGLAVAIEMVEALGGRLELDPNALRWQACIRLPISKPPTLLVVDDNADLVTLVQRYLGGHQVAVVGTNQGSQVLEIARRIHPALILLDLMMPGQDGWEVLASLKGEPSLASIPVVICSVLKEVELARALGAGDYLPKPVNQSQLLDVLRRWLGTLYPVA